MTEEPRSPAWMAVIDQLALQALRVHLQVEFDIRAIMRTQGEPGDVLERVEKVLRRGVEVAKELVLTARTVLIVNRLDGGEDQVRKVAEQVGGMHLFLLARVSGWACVSYFREVGDTHAVELTQMFGGVVPLCVELESDTASLFALPAVEGIPSA